MGTSLIHQEKGINFWKACLIREDIHSDIVLLVMICDKSFLKLLNKLKSFKN